MQTDAYKLEADSAANIVKGKMIATQSTPPVDTKAIQAKAQTPLNVACARLKAAGLRITQPRIAIIDALIKRGQPTTIEQIHEDLADGSCDLVTVYRCLSAFEDIGLVRRSFYHNGTSLYALSLDEVHPYYAICKETNRVEAIDPATTAELRRQVLQIEETLKARGYTNVTHVVEFFGVAPAAPTA